MLNSFFWKRFSLNYSACFFVPLAGVGTASTTYSMVSATGVVPYSSAAGVAPSSVGSSSTAAIYSTAKIYSVGSSTSSATSTISYRDFFLSDFLVARDVRTLRKVMSDLTVLKMLETECRNSNAAFFFFYSPYAFPTIYLYSGVFGSSYRMLDRDYSIAWLCSRKNPSISSM